MQLVSFREIEADAFSRKHRPNRLARRLPLSQLLREFLRQEPSLKLHLMEEDELPDALLGQLKKEGIPVLSKTRFFLHDRSPLRLAVIVGRADLSPEKGGQKHLLEKCSSFIRNAGRTDKEFVLLPFASILPDSKFPGLFLVAWRAEALLGEYVPWDKEALRDLQKRLPATPPDSAISRQAEASARTLPTEQESAQDCFWEYSILGRRRSNESRKYYLRQEEGTLRLALFSSPEDAGAAALHFARLMKAGESVLNGHKRLLHESPIQAPLRSLSLELRQDGHLQCINYGIPVLLWRQKDGRAYLLPQTVFGFDDSQKTIRRLKGLLQPEDGLLVLGGYAEKTELKALASLMAVAGKGSEELLERSISRKLDELGLGKALYFRHKKA